ncbi:MAG: dTDP-4-dehydrorhamnose reductase [Bacteroidales bacterium]|jgi:dTDP-4-dehydrorhamnose reductase|nr:dTDP-4-dehydrorhamnose reductase [Bacteroidales bacterium]
MRILVTGSNGQLGRSLQKIAETDRIHDWYFTDVEELNITKATQVKHYLNSQNIDVCINCAAYTAVDKAEDDQQMAYILNATAPQILASACRETNALLIHISTDYVFDGLNYKPYQEDDPISPASAYAKSKADGEQAILNSGAKYVIVRTSWLYSEFGGNFVKTMIRLGKEKESLNVVADQVGTPTYAFDLAATILLIAESEKTEDHDQIYHFSNEGAISWYDFAQTIMELEKLDCKVFPIESKDYPVKTKRPFYSVLNKTKIKNHLGIQIPYWRKSLIKCLEQING